MDIIIARMRVICLLVMASSSINIDEHVNVAKHNATNQTVNSFSVPDSSVDDGHFFDQQHQSFMRVRPLNICYMDAINYSLLERLATLTVESFHFFH
ncbi:hypothetical protein [Idiomarina xiamenensis]|uniref:Uncharacterized protein n=1 Tax=Idiomarina xiamenensis 10-D-4 TaxID=740709 RepID=K2L4R4_9GAMM|nr:hypothetical protein [Idiomarina xiamenensis]EKE84820.1 hypothetical protein A10D4_04380 [Idiomarina xiamenensis 10-D-4]